MKRPAIWRTVIGLLAVTVVAVLVVIYFRTSTPAADTWSAPAGGAGTLTRSVTLYFGNGEGTGLVAQNRELIAADDEESAIRAVANELLRGPSGGGAVALFDARSRVRAVFLDPGGMLVIDFAGMPFPENASARTCDLALQSLMRVVDERFTSVERLSLLVDGAPLAELERRLALPLVIEPGAWLGTADNPS